MIPADDDGEAVRLSFAPVILGERIHLPILRGNGESVEILRGPEPLKVAAYQQEVDGEAASSFCLPDALVDLVQCAVAAALTTPYGM